MIKYKLTLIEAGDIASCREDILEVGILLSTIIERSGPSRVERSQCRMWYTNSRIMSRAANGVRCERGKDCGFESEPHLWSGTQSAHSS